MLNPSSNTEEADSNIDRQDVQDRISVSDPTPEPEPLPGSSSDGLPADLPADLSTVLPAGVPEAEVPEMATSPSTVAPESVPMDIEVATQLPETPHLNPLPQGERKECEPVTTSAPETVIVEISDAAIVPEEAIKAPESESKPEPVVAEEQEAGAENVEKIQV